MLYKIIFTTHEGQNIWYLESDNDLIKGQFISTELLNECESSNIGIMPNHTESWRMVANAHLALEIDYIIIANPEPIVILKIYDAPKTKSYNPYDELEEIRDKLLFVYVHQLN